MSQKPYSELRLILAVAAVGKFFIVAALLFLPSWIIGFFPNVTMDLAHQTFMMMLAALALVFALGALLALLQPLRNRGVVTVIALDHFVMFLLGIVILVQGTDLSLFLLVPGMIYTLVVSVLLVHYFPVADYTAELRETADELVGQVKKNLNKKEEIPTIDSSASSSHE